MRHAVAIRITAGSSARSCRIFSQSPAIRGLHARLAKNGDYTINANERKVTRDSFRKPHIQSIFALDAKRHEKIPSAVVVSTKQISCLFVNLYAQAIRGVIKISRHTHPKFYIHQISQPWRDVKCNSASEFIFKYEGNTKV